MRAYKCEKCGISLIEGLEYQFPPRLSYWYCPACQLVFEEQGTGGIKLFRLVKGNEKLCVQDEIVKGCIQNMTTGERTFPDSV